MKLYIFNKSEKIYISIYFKIFIFLLVILVLAVLIETLIFIFALLLALFTIFYIIINFFRTEAINGSLAGLLILNSDSINIKSKQFFIRDLKKIEIRNTDIKGDMINYQFSFQPHFSNGTDNFIQLTLNSGEKYKYYFQQTKNEKINYNRKSLINYHLHNKISWLHLLDLLEITDYDKIQEFKKSLHPQRNSTLI